MNPQLMIILLVFSEIYERLGTSLPWQHNEGHLRKSWPDLHFEIFFYFESPWRSYWFVHWSVVYQITQKAAKFDNDFSQQCREVHMCLLHFLGVSGQTTLFFPDNQIFNQEHFSVHLDPGAVFQPYTYKMLSWKRIFQRWFSKENTSVLSTVTYLLL